MPPSNPTLIEVFLAGGVLMIPFLIVAIAWLVFSFRYVSMRRRSVKGLLGLWLFPVAFALLAITNWIFLWHVDYKRMELSGLQDPMVIIQHGLRLTRSGLLICGFGMMSFLVCAVALALPLNNNKDEQVGDGDAEEAV